MTPRQLYEKALAESKSRRGAKKSEGDKVPTKPKKSRQRRKEPPKTDFFTLLCRSDLKVECVKEYRFHPTRMWRFDYAIPAHKIAIEVEGGVWTGGRHTSSVGFLGDMEKYNTATVMGWRVLRTVPDELNTNATIRMIRDAIENTSIGIDAGATE